MADEPEGIHEFIRQANALIAYYLHIPFPEKLSDEQWVEKWKQVEWLSVKKIIGK
ncbi:MAG: hypothetical protein K2Q03_05735 [Sphingobacteriaceae bacterium]|nr:hypothetical protein [Sphingobacteriaceae bacterium]